MPAADRIVRDDRSVLRILEQRNRCRECFRIGLGEWDRVEIWRRRSKRRRPVRKRRVTREVRQERRRTCSPTFWLTTFDAKWTSTEARFWRPGSCRRPYGCRWSSLSDCWAGATPGRCLKNKIWLEQNSRLRQRKHLCFKDLRDRNTRKGGGEAYTFKRVEVDTLCTPWQTLLTYVVVFQCNQTKLIMF